MLRATVAIVLLLNLILGVVIWALHQGHLSWPDAWRGESREPERMTRQIKPEAMVLKPAKGNAPAASSSASAPSTPSTSGSGTDKPAAAAPAPAASAAPSSSLNATTNVATLGETTAAANKTVCLQTRDNDKTTSVKVTAAFKDLLPAANVQTTTSQTGGLWMVYMGKYPDIATANKKLAEVKQLKIPGDYALISKTDGLQPGISLGAFRIRESADSRLQEVSKKGVKTARVVVVNPPKEVYTFKLPELEVSLREKVDELVRKSGGKALEECPRA